MQVYWLAALAWWLYKGVSTCFFGWSSNYLFFFDITKSSHKRTHGVFQKVTTPYRMFSRRSPGKLKITHFRTMTFFERRVVAYHVSGWEGCGKRKNENTKSCVHECAALPVATAIKAVSKTGILSYIFLLCGTQNLPDELRMSELSQKFVTPGCMALGSPLRLLQKDHTILICWITNAVSCTKCLDPQKRSTCFMMSVCPLLRLLQRHQEHFDAGPKMSNNTVMSGNSKIWQ